MVEEYETAAFALTKGEHSDIISAYSENNFYPFYESQYS